MAVNISFASGGSALNETDALDFGTVQAGTKSAIKTVTVTNSGDSDALCQANGYSVIFGRACDQRRGAGRPSRARTYGGCGTVF